MTPARRFVVLVVVGVAVLQALWVVVVPPFRGSDEFDHAYRASGVAGGQWRAVQVPEDGRGLLVEADDDLVRAAHAQCDSLSYPGPDNCRAVEELGGGRVLVASGAGNYNPAYYWLVGTAGKPFDGATRLYAMRFASAFLCLVLVALSAWSVSRSPGPGTPWPGIGLVLAMSPVMVYSTAITAPNGLEMAAAMALWTALLSMRGADMASSGRLLAVAVVAACLLVTLRLLGPLFALLIVSVCWAFDPALIRRAYARHRGGFLMGGLLVLACTAASAAWVLSTGSMRPGPTPEGSSFRVSAIALWPLQSIAAFPYRDQPGPAVVYPVVLLGFLAVVVAALRLGDRRARLVILVAVLIAMALPLLITAATYSGRGAMWQGRYGLPFSMGIVLLATSLLNRVSPPTRIPRLPVWLGAVLLSGVTAACLMKIVSDELRRPASAHDMAWWAPPASLVVGACVGAFLILAAAVGQLRGVDAEGDPG